MAKIVRPLEVDALRRWAVRVGLLRDNAKFEQSWNRDGEICGMENDVYFEEATQRWWKRNNLTFHVTWLEYFHRLALHNWLFPEAQVTLEGFVERDSSPYPLVSQPHVMAQRGARRDETRSLMQTLGFSHERGDDYVHSELGLRVEDLHDENAVLHPCGEVAVFDPVIYLINHCMKVTA